MRAFFVLGPESSGTRLVTQLLIAAGCVGDAGHSQRFDTESFGDAPDVVLRRSVPHCRAWLNWQELADRATGRDIMAVICVRDPTVMVKSQIDNGHVRNAEHAKRNIAAAYRMIFEQASAPYVLAVYESLVLHPEQAQAALLTSVGLRSDARVTITDEDAKRWRP